MKFLAHRTYIFNLLNSRSRSLKYVLTPSRCTIILLHAVDNCPGGKIVAITRHVSFAQITCYAHRKREKHTGWQLKKIQMASHNGNRYWPSKTAPRISNMQARTNAWRSVSTLAPTEVPNEFATSFAPIPNARINAIMKPTTNIHIWSCWKLSSPNISERLTIDYTA